MIKLGVNSVLFKTVSFRAAGGGWIAKDYPSYGDIGVEKEWAKWAEDVIVKNSAIH